LTESGRASGNGARLFGRKCGREKEGPGVGIGWRRPQELPGPRHFNKEQTLLAIV